MKFYNKVLCLSKYLLCSPLSYRTLLLHGGGFRARDGWMSGWTSALLKSVGAKSARHLTAWRPGRETEPVLIAWRTNLQLCPVQVLTRRQKFKGFLLLTLPPSVFTLLPFIAVTCKVKVWPFFESKWESRWDAGTEADFSPERLAREAEVLRLKSVLGHYQDITYSRAIHRLSHHFSTRNEGWSDTQVI